MHMSAKRRKQTPSVSPTELKNDSLPQQLLAVRNLDKKNHEQWAPGDDLLNLPHPFRGVLLGPPNCGKTTTVKNILMRQDPPFKRMYIIHCDGEYTQEYDDVNGMLLKSIPYPEQWPGKDKTLVVVDDMELKTLKKDQRMALDRLFGSGFSVFCGFCSSHTPRCLNPSPFWPILNPNNTRDLLFAYSYTPSKFISCFCGTWGTRPDFTSFSHQPQLDFVVFLSQPGGLPHVAGLPRE